MATDASLRARAMSALGRLSLFCLRHASEPDEIVRRLARWLLLLREIRSAPGGSDALELDLALRFHHQRAARPGGFWSSGSCWW